MVAQKYFCDRYTIVNFKPFRIQKQSIKEDATNFFVLLFIARFTRTERPSKIRFDDMYHYSFYAGLTSQQRILASK